jgi:hypothetical protein
MYLVAIFREVSAEGYIKRTLKPNSKEIQSLSVICTPKNTSSKMATISARNL